MWEKHLFHVNCSCPLGSPWNSLSVYGRERVWRAFQEVPSQVCVLTCFRTSVFGVESKNIKTENADLEIIGWAFGISERRGNRGLVIYNKKL